MSTQQDKFTAIADAIRAKKGTTAPIVANDFASEIATIETGGSSGVESSKYYLHKRVLTVDGGFQIEKIAISGGDTIDLGAGVDVEASTGWSDSILHRNSHPAMTFQEWSCSLEVVDNQITLPDVIYTDYTAGAIYCTTDGLNHYVNLDPTDGLVATTDEETSVTKDGEATLISAWLSNSVTYLPTYAFRDCYAMTMCSLSTSLQSTGSHIFYGSRSLRGMEIPSSTTSIPISFLNGCYALQIVSIPHSVIHIGGAAFYACYSLTEIVFPTGVLSELKQFGYYTYSLRSVNCEVLSYLTSIVTNAFLASASLRCVQLPSGITSIEALAFNSALQTGSVIVLNSTTPPTIETNSFTGTMCAFLVPEESVDAYKNATNWVAYADYIYPNTAENRIKFGV